MRKHAHTRGVWGEIFVKLGVLRSLPRPYLYPNATSPTRVHGGVYHYTRQLSRAISVTIELTLCMSGLHLIDELMTWTRTVSTLYITLKLVQ